MEATSGNWHNWISILTSLPYWLNQVKPLTYKNVSSPTPTTNSLVSRHSPPSRNFTLQGIEINYREAWNGSVEMWMLKSCSKLHTFQGCFVWKLRAKLLPCTLHIAWVHIAMNGGEFHFAHSCYRNLNYSNVKTHLSVKWKICIMHDED